MILEMKIPSAGESVTEVAIGTWLAEDQSYVQKDQEIAEVESDKATLPLIAAESGKITILIPAGQKANVGDIACTLDTSAKQPASAKEAKRKSEIIPNGQSSPVKTVESRVQEKLPEIPPTPAAEAKTVNYDQVKVTPLARTLMDDHGLDVDDIIRGLRKLTRKDVEQVLNQEISTFITAQTQPIKRKDERTPMTPLRRKLSKRLVAVKNETAMLTTFNEVDMSVILALRKKYQQAFQEKHGHKLGLMSFFIKASAHALALFPRVNAQLDSDDMVTPNYVDIAVAVQTDKGLMVPVIRNVQSLHIFQIEGSLAVLAQKARTGKLSIEEMTGGTFTITNGGVFGSMLSTPIINPPQSAILGMHNIVERPVVVDGQVVIRPIMYVALSYDHRLIDGRDSVSFLVKVKEMLESPLQLLLGGIDPEKSLLGL